MTIGVEMGAEGENNFKRTTTTTETRECYVFTKLNSYFFWAHSSILLPSLLWLGVTPGLHSKQWNVGRSDLLLPGQALTKGKTALTTNRKAVTFPPEYKEVNMTRVSLWQWKSSVS